MTNSTANPATRPGLPVLVAVESSAARVATEELAQLVRDARDQGNGATADLLSAAAAALHRAGWAPAPTDAEVLAELNREDVPRNTAIHLADELARTLLEARGWTRDYVRPDSWAWTRPGGTPRSDGGRFGDDYVWELEDALAQALTAEAMAVRS